MEWVTNIFDWAVVYYREFMGDFMHYSFYMRTAFFVLLLGLFVVIGKYAIEYIIGPIIIFILFQVLFRAWNFFITETRQEWIYIRFYSKNDSRYNHKYLSLCDKINDNRRKMANMRYVEVFKRKNLRKLSRGIAIFVFIVVALWLGAFGIYANNELTSSNELPSINVQTRPESNPPNIILGDVPYFVIYGPSLAESPTWITDESRVLRLNSEGMIGSRLRSGPSFEYSYVIEILWGEQRMEFTGVFYTDDYVPDMYWLQVIAESGQIGYISSQLVEEDV